MSQQEQGQGGHGFKPTWSFAHEVTCPDTGVSVLVNRTNHPVPQYSFRFGRYKGEEGSPLLPFVGARVTKENIFSGEMDTSNLDALRRCLDEAEAWAKDDLARHCDEAQQRAEARERRRANEGKPEPRVTGKTAKKKQGKTPAPAAEQSAEA